MTQRAAHAGAGGKGPGRPSAERAKDQASSLLAEHRLVKRVYDHCDREIRAACAYSSVPADFLGALTANESGGKRNAVRFEPAVYRHLRLVSEGKYPVYNGFRAADLQAEIQEMLHPKAADFHARYLGASFAAEQNSNLANLEDEALRELASSWGFTQIMGYHLIGREGTVRDLLEPAFHFRLAIELLSEFAGAFQLDPMREFEEMFRCWNTGSPYGVTFDPTYAAKGLRRMGLYREIAKGALNSRPT